MSSNQYKDMYCKKFSKELDMMLVTILGVQQAIKSLLRQLLAKMELIKNMTPSLPTDILREMDQMANNIISQVPTPDKINDLLQIAAQCELVANDVKIKGINGLKFDFGNSVADLIDQTVKNAKDALGAILIEYPVAMLMTQIDDLLKKAKVKEYLELLQKYTTCANAICGGSLQAQLNEITTIKDQLYLSSQGILDRNALYTKMNFVGSMITNCETCYNKITDSKNNALNSLQQTAESVVNAVKSARGSLGF